MADLAVTDTRDAKGFQGIPVPVPVPVRSAGEVLALL
jgi:hypothetical protein